MRCRIRTRGLEGKGFIAAAWRSRHGTRLPLLPVWTLAGLLVIAAAGCSGSPVDSRAEEEVVAERALQTALEGGRAGFVRLVAPSFLEQLRAEMPDSDDDVLGGVLIAGFLEDIPFAGVVEAHYRVREYGESLVVYVWGRFIDAAGSEIVIKEAGAVRIPLVFEDGRPYIDLLDL